MRFIKEKSKTPIDIAERKVLSENDYKNGAKKLINKDQNLYSTRDGLQVMMMNDVYISATHKIKGEVDWYGVLGVDPLADDEAVKKRYKKLSLWLHPDKNRFKGAEGAFKLVQEAWCLLSDKSERAAYDRKRKPKQVKKKKKRRMQKSPKTHSVINDMRFKERAKRAMDIAERKLSENDYNGAKKFLHKAQNLYSKLDGLKQVMTIIDVYISATNKINGEVDWYGILGVDPLAEVEAVKKHYKMLALLLHPDKNRFYGAEGAFKLVLEAWCLLSDKAKRAAYDQKRKVTQEKSGMQQENKPEHEHESKPDSSIWKQEKVTVYFTRCERCKAYCRYVNSSYLNKIMLCPNCGQDFVATKIFPETSH